MKRGKLEDKTVLKVLELDTITAAFDYLKERLDPEKDVFAAAERFRAMMWPPGEFATDFLVRYIDEALQAELTPRQACVFFVTQMPHEIQNKLKEWIRTQGAELSEDNAMKMAGEVKRALFLKDIPLDKGFRGSPVGRVARVDTSRKDSERELAAMLDTGASPCVMDSDNARKTRLFERMIPARTDVYGLCNNPVAVLGYADAEIFLERGEPAVQ